MGSLSVQWVHHNPRLLFLQIPFIKEAKLCRNSSNVGEMENKINEKYVEKILNKPAKCCVDSQQNFFDHCYMKKLRMKNVIHKKYAII